MEQDNLLHIKRDGFFKRNLKKISREVKHGWDWYEKKYNTNRAVRAIADFCVAGFAVGLAITICVVTVTLLDKVLVGIGLFAV